MGRRFLFIIAVAMLIPLAPAHAVGESITAVVVDGPLRAGAFTQVFHATGSGFNAATMTAVVEQQSGPGTVLGADVRITGSSQVVGQLSASSSGSYVVQLCVAPKASATCSAATAVKAFTATVAGAPTSMRIAPEVQSAPASAAVSFGVSVVDASARPTLLAVGESVAVATSASDGSVTVDGVDTPTTGLNPRLRVAGVGWFTVANDVAGSSTQITVSALGFGADDVVGYLATDPPPQDIALVLDEPVSVTTLGAGVSIMGTVLDATGDPISGASVSGVIDGTDSGTTSTDTTGADGRFSVTFASSSDVSGQHDDVDLTASELVHGTDQSRAVVYFTANGRTPISDLAIDAVPISSFTGSIEVPAGGTASTESASAAVVTFTAAVPGSTVTVSTSRGALSADDGVRWNAGRGSMEVVTDASGAGRVYVHSTQAGLATIEVSAARVASGVVRVSSPSSAARDVLMHSSLRRISAGDRALVTIAVDDAFGNAVADARIDVALRSDSAGHLAAGGRQATVRTDADGNAHVEVVTGPKEKGVIRLVARGDVPECGVRNQYACPINEPGAGFAASRGVAHVSIDVVARIVRVTAPTFDAQVSTNQFIAVTASTRGIARGTLALLKTGHREIARALVASGGRLTFPAVHASGDGVFTIAVAGISTRVQVHIRAFGITGVQRGARNAFTIATGAWRPGTQIVLVRNGHAFGSATVARAHQPVVMRLANRPGTYQVQVRTPLGIVRGAKAWTIR